MAYWFTCIYHSEPSFVLKLKNLDVLLLFLSFTDSIHNFFSVVWSIVLVLNFFHVGGKPSCSLRCMHLWAVSLGLIFSLREC